MEEPPLLVPVDRIVGCIQVERDPGRRLRMGIEEELDEQRLDGIGVMADAAVAVRPRGRVLEAVERALARERRQPRTARLEPAESRAEG